MTANPGTDSVDAAWSGTGETCDKAANSRAVQAPTVRSAAAATCSASDSRGLNTHPRYIPQAIQKASRICVR
jgi:hypothetical protein